MLKRSSVDVLGATRKDFFPVFILLLSSFVWFNMSFLMINNFENAFNLTGTELSLIRAVYSISVIGSSVVGSIFSWGVRRFSVLRMWMILGTISSLLPILFNFAPYLSSIVLGFSLGIGMPQCLAYFADASTVENRGRMGGITFLSIYLSAALLTIVFGSLNLGLGFVLLAVWRGIGLLSFILLKPESNAIEKPRPCSFVKVFKDRSFGLYLIPWIMFILIDRFEGPILSRYLQSPALSTAALIGPIGGAFSAFIGGLLSDRIGRKRVAIGGFVALGLAYAFVGIAPDLLVSWYFYAAVDGIAWGILLVTFLLTLWGDLSESGGREKYYVIGGTPFYFTSIMESILTLYVVQIPAYAAFSLASFFLFMAVLPLLYAPETLPEKKMELRRLKTYVEQAKKLTQKRTEQIPA